VHAAGRGVVTKVGLAMSMATVFALAQPNSTLACAPRRSHDIVARHAGTLGNASSLTGIASSILEISPYYSGNNPTGTVATVMLTTNNVTQWAQWGWYKSKIDNGNIQRQIGMEFYISAADNTFLFFGAKPIGDQTDYQIWYTSGSYKFYVNDQLYVSEGGLAAPTQYQIFGETHDKSDQFPGSQSAHETLVSTAYFTGSTHIAHTVTSATFNDDSTVSGISHPSAGRYETWDQGCAT